MTHEERLLQLARRVCDAYARQPGVDVALVTGSVARGLADAHSDLEIDVWRSRPPEEERRSDPIRQMGADPVFLWPLEQDEWSDRFRIEDSVVEVSQFLRATIEGYVADVTVQLDTSVRKQLVLSKIVEGLPLVGDRHVARLRIAAAYPDALARAVVEEALWFPGADRLEALIDRNDTLALRGRLAALAGDVMTALHAINRIYIAHPWFKWMDRLIARMSITPPDVAARLRATLDAGAPEDSVTAIRGLIEDIRELVRQHLPDARIPPSLAGPPGS